MFLCDSARAAFASEHVAKSVYRQDYGECMMQAEPVLVSVVEGNRQYLDGGAMFGNAPRAVWSRWCRPDELGRIELATRGLLIECGDTKLLCECGIGNFFSAKLAQRYGVCDPEENKLLTSLAALGVDTADIDYVVLSHLHFDHVGGLLAEDGSLNFPRARYVVGSKALARAAAPHPRDRASFIDSMIDKLTASGRLVTVEGEQLDGVLETQLAFIFSDGHTPGQMHTVFRGRQRKIFFAGDLIPGVAWVHLPITAGYDRFAELVIDEKRQLYNKAVTAGWLIFYMHDPQVIASQVRHEHNRYVASEPLTELRRYEL